MTDVARGEYRPDTRITFDDYAEQWGKSYTGRTAAGLRPETLAEYVRDLRPARKRFGRMRLSAITPADVKGYARALADEDGLAPATVRRRLAPLRALFATDGEGQGGARGEHERAEKRQWVDEQEGLLRRTGYEVTWRTRDWLEARTTSVPRS